MPANATTETALLGGGCFWCLDAVFRELAGVESVESGYAGGRIASPSYDDVCRGDTGHAEVVQVTFDPSVITYREILEIFFAMHDPTTLNRQGNDVGEWYRSVIFYHSDEQRATAEDMIKNFAPTLYKDPIVTQLEPLDKFWPADDYMQNYYNNNPSAGYCMVVIDPKIQKLRQKFAAKMK